MTVLFAGNHPSEFTEGFEFNDTSYFDSDYVPNSMTMIEGGIGNTPSAYLWAEPAGDTAWFHFRRRPTSEAWRNTHGSNGILFEVFDSDGDVVAGISADAGTVGAMAVGDTTTYGATTDLANNVSELAVPHTYDLRVTVGANIEAELYFGGTLLGACTAANTAGKGVPVRFRFSNYAMHYGAGPGYYSEVFVSDQPTVGQRLALLHPAGAGNYTSWTGTYADLADADPVTGAEGGTGDKASYTLEAYGGAIGTVKALALVNRLTRPVVGPTEARNFLRKGGTDYPGANLSPDFVVGPRATVWTLDPEDSGDLTTADLATLEIGIEALAS